MKQHAQVAIIGGGAVGLCTAYFLQKQGYDVAVFDRGEIGERGACSWGNAGWIVPGHVIPLASPGVIKQGMKWMMDPSSPFYIKPRIDKDLMAWIWQFQNHCNAEHVQRCAPVLFEMGLESQRLFRHFSDVDGMDFGFENQGLLYVSLTDKGLAANHEEAHIANEIGYEVSLLTPEQVHEREPAVRPDSKGGIFFHRDTHLTPNRFMPAMGGYLAEQGVALHAGTEVKGLAKKGKTITTIRTDQGDFTADEVVLAAGSWTPALARDLKLSLPIQPAKGYSMTVPQQAPAIRTPVLLSERKVAVTPMMNNQVRFAGTLEIAGLDLSITRRRVDAIVDAIPQYFPDFDNTVAREAEVWAGLRPCTPDGLPFLGRSKAYENLTIAAGHAMVGMSLAAVSGQLAAEVVARKAASISLDLMAVDRFD